MKNTTGWINALVACALCCVPLSASAEDEGTQARGRHENQERMEADNTGRNVRDRDEAAKTVFDQGSSEAERELAAKIRREIVEDDSLSTYAQNIKIIVADGTITLRGPVESTREFHRIQEIARRNAGQSKIENLLEVTPDEESHDANHS